MRFCVNGLGAVFALALFLAVHASAQTADVPFGGLSHDNTLPVEIASDSLSLDNAASRAVFSGNVTVGQGELRLNADRIEVAYGRSGGAIESVSATGNVMLTNGGEAAEASAAEYDVASGEVVMTGDVILTQGPNAISGDVLRIDLNAGTGRMEGRVRTIFQPQTAPAAGQ